MEEIHLITQWYRDANPERMAELMQATCKNLQNPHISHIHFLESLPEQDFFPLLRQANCNVTMAHFSRKARFYPRLSKQTKKTPWANRLTAGTAFEFANKYLPGKTAILANFDIYLDDSLRFLRIDRWLSPQSMYFLSRYEIEETSSSIGTQCGPKYIGSHDTFMFVPPLPKPFIQKAKDLALGMPGMENKLIFECRRLGIMVLNPCLTIKSWHLHRSGVKNAILPLANGADQSGIVRPAKLLRNPTADDLSQ